MSTPKIARVTRTGKLFCNFNGKFFYMLANGKRHFSEGELKTATMPDMKEWEWAEKKWKDSKLVDLEGKQLEMAEALYLKIYGEDGTAENMSYGANEEQYGRITDARHKKVSGRQFAQNAINNAGKVKIKNNRPAYQKLDEVKGADKLRKFIK